MKSSSRDNNRKIKLIIPQPPRTPSKIASIESTKDLRCHTHDPTANPKEMRKVRNKRRRSLTMANIDQPMCQEQTHARFILMAKSIGATRCSKLNGCFQSPDARKRYMNLSNRNKLYVHYGNKPTIWAA